MRPLTGQKRSGGFTLVELILVIMIIAVLAGAILLVFPGKSDRATATKVINDLRNLKSASKMYYFNAGFWPSSLEDIAPLLSGNLKLECADEICYDLAFDNNGVFMGVKAELSMAPSGLRRILADSAAANGMFSSIEIDELYSGGPSAFSPVRVSGVASSGAIDSPHLFLGLFNDMSQYSVLNGSWSIVDGKLRGASSGPERRLAFGDPEWTDHTISVSATFLDGFVQGNSGYGIYYRADQEPGFRDPGISGYIFQFDTGLNAFVVRIVTNGHESRPIQRTPMPEGFDIYSPHNIEISLSGATHTIKVDGSTVMQFEDTTYTSGSAGLRTWNRSDVEFTSIEVNRQ